MSRASRFHGVYEDLAAIGNLVDDVVLSLRSGADPGSDSRDLAELLSYATSPKPRSVAEIRLSSALTRKGQIDRWTELGRRLLSGDAGKRELAALDQLAETIDEVARRSTRR